MSARFKPNNFFAILIAVALMATGFILAFIHKQTVSAEAPVAADTAQTAAVKDQKETE